MTRTQEIALLERLCLDQNGPMFSMSELDRRLGQWRCFCVHVWKGRTRITERQERILCGVLYSELVGADQW